MKACGLLRDIVPSEVYQSVDGVEASRSLVCIVAILYKGEDLVYQIRVDLRKVRTGYF